jgi:hypothetical protein
MTQQRTPIDFIAYDADGKVVLLAEAKSRRGTSASWAAKLRRNMLAHSVLPRSNTVHLTIKMVVEIAMVGRGLARGGRSGKLLILRLTPRGLRRLRLDTTRSCRISMRTAR